MRRAGFGFTAPLVGILLGVLGASPSGAWLTEDHYLATLRAVSGLPEAMPRFFVEGAETVAQASKDPDILKAHDLVQLRDQERPEHYMDFELVRGGMPLPATRYEFIERLMRPDSSEAEPMNPARVGLLPYSIVEGTQKLAIAFAEFRRWPDHENIQAKALLYAGLLAHYAGDLCQPLHTTIHHDGRASETGKSPHSGIHRRVDSLFEDIGWERLVPPTGDASARRRPIGDLLEGVQDEFLDSHRRVDRVYGLFETPEPESVGLSEEQMNFARERFQATADFTSRLFYTAWEMSETLELPSFLERRQPDVPR